MTDEREPYDLSRCYHITPEPADYELVKHGEVPSWMTQVTACDPHDGYWPHDGSDAWLGPNGRVWAMTADIRWNTPTT